VNEFSFKFPSQAFIKGMNGEYYFYRGVNSASESYRVSVSDSTKVLFNHLMDIGNPGIGHVQEKNAFSSNSKTVFLMESLLPNVYNLSSSEILEEISLNFGLKTITEEELSQYSTVMDFFKKIDKQGFYCISGIASNDQILVLQVVYQEAIKDLEYYYIFNSLAPDFATQTINCSDTSAVFLAFSKLHKCHKNYLVLSVTPFDIINSHLEDSFQPHFFENNMLEESDNPIILLLKLKI
jgi:hypothetical protein